MSDNGRWYYSEVVTGVELVSRGVQQSIASAEATAQTVQDEYDHCFAGVCPDTVRRSIFLQ